LAGGDVEFAFSAIAALSGAGDDDVGGAQGRLDRAGKLLAARYMSVPPDVVAIAVERLGERPDAIGVLACVAQEQ
jgi:hypothetical protein